MNDLSEEMSLLLDNYWITKENNKDNYYKIKSKITELREIAGKLGCDIICNNKLIKLEKLPFCIDKTFNIKAFDDKLDYVLFMCLLLFLNDKGLDEQFILSNLTSYISNILATIDGANKPDWTKRTHRKSLTDVLKFSCELGIIRLRDGSDDAYADNETAEALFENTLLSHYVIRNFKFDIFSCHNAEDIINKEKETIDEKDYKKIISYRGLFYYPHIFFGEIPEDAKNYIRNIRFNINKDVEKYLDGELILAQNEALVSIEETRKNETFPNLNKSITDIVLLVCTSLNEVTEEIVPLEKFNIIIEDVYKEYKDYFSKIYRDLPLYKFDEVIREYMESFKLIKVIDSSVIVYPVVYFYEGYFKSKISEEEKNYEFLTLDLEV